MDNYSRYKFHHQNNILLQISKISWTIIQSFETPIGVPPIHDHDHVIHLILGSFPPNIRPYRYLYVQKSEIEHMIAEMLEASIIQPSQSSFSAPAVLVHKKDGSW